MEQAYVNVLTRGDLSSLRWIASPLRHFVPSNPNVQLCRVYYASLNFRDIMLATGKLPPDAIPGLYPSQLSMLYNPKTCLCFDFSFIFLYRRYSAAAVHAGNGVFRARPQWAACDGFAAG